MLKTHSITRLRLKNEKQKTVTKGADFSGCLYSIDDETFTIT